MVSNNNQDSIIFEISTAQVIPYQLQSFAAMQITQILVIRKAKA